MILLFLEPGCQNHSQYVLWHWAASTGYDNSAVLSHSQTHFDILYTWANTHMYLCTACSGMKRTGGSVGKTGWRGGGEEKKRKKQKGLYDSHNSREHIVQLRHRPVPRRPYHWLTELDSDSCSAARVMPARDGSLPWERFSRSLPYQLQNSCQTLRSLDREFNS